MFVFKKSLGSAYDANQKIVKVFLVTGRTLTMAIPGGSLLVGRVSRKHFRGYAGHSFIPSEFEDSLLALKDVLDATGETYPELAPTSCKTYAGAEQLYIMALNEERAVQLAYSALGLRTILDPDPCTLPQNHRWTNLRVFEMKKNKKK